MVKNPDIIVKHTPNVCQEYDENLEEVESKTTTQRQVFYLPTLKL